MGLRKVNMFYRAYIHFHSSAADVYLNFKAHSKYFLE